jgi:hypothetical protein
MQIQKRPRGRGREWYAKNKEEISKRRRQTWELKKQTTTPIVADSAVCHTLVLHNPESPSCKTEHLQEVNVLRTCVMFFNATICMQ